MSRLFVDTSGWYAFLVSHESSHRAVRSILLEGNHLLITSNVVFSELFTLLVARHQEHAALSFGKTLKEGKIGALYRVSESDEEEAWKLLNARRGRGLSYADATIIAMTTRMGIKSIVTLDHGFREFGLEMFP